MKKLITILLSLTLIVLLSACGDPINSDIGESEPQQSVTNSRETGQQQNTINPIETEWAIYWYLCGSDLETHYGAATNDLVEMLEVDLPDNVKVVIQTGGAMVWQNELINADKIQRYVYDSNGLYLIEELPSASMGDPRTLTSFLSFAKENHPAKRTMVIFWNHGGGSVTGAAFDELYDMDSLTLPELYYAFTTVFGANTNNQPIDIIGFDTCLMATIDTAYTFSDIAKYLVASEELEPGNGWYYSGILNAISENPTIKPAELSKVICDTYVEGCILEGTQDNITLSVTDLSKVGNLITAYDNFGKEALANAIESPTFLTLFSRVAGSIENYGGNTREQGFTNMADLGHLARNSADILPDTFSQVLAALEDCIEYKVYGKYRKESTGLSCYYSYNGDMDDWSVYSQLGPSEAFRYLYTYGLTGTLTKDGMDYISKMNYKSLPELLTLNNVNWNDAIVTVDEEGLSTLTLGNKANEILSSITFELFYVDVEEDIMLCLGSDNDIIADWETGVFKDNFRGVWGSLDGALCYMEISYEGDDYNIYSIPILLNDEDYNLNVIYDFTTEEFYILGARKSLDESGAADKNLRSLMEGDKVQTIHFVTILSEDSDESIAVPVDTIYVTDTTSFAETELGDGLFIMIYVMTDSQGNTAYSSPVIFESIDGEIFTSVE